MTKEALQRSLKTCVLKAQYTLSSGLRAKFYVDCKKALLSQLRLSQAADVMGAIVRDQFPEVQYIAGTLSPGSMMLATILGQECRKDVICVRDQPKKQGNQKQLELPESYMMNKPTVLVDDVVTTGLSLLRAIRILESGLVKVVGTLVLVKRTDGVAEELFRKQSVRLVSVFDSDELTQ